MTLRFGAIANYEEVNRFFATVPADSLHFLRLSSKSKPLQYVIEIEFDSSEAQITIIAGSVSRNTSNPPLIAAQPPASPPTLLKWAISNRNFPV